MEPSPRPGPSRPSPAVTGWLATTPMPAPGHTRSRSPSRRVESRSSRPPRPSIHPQSRADRHVISIVGPFTRAIGPTHSSAGLQKQSRPAVTPHGIFFRQQCRVIGTVWHCQLRDRPRHSPGGVARGRLTPSTPATSGRRKEIAAVRLSVTKVSRLNRATAGESAWLWASAGDSPDRNQRRIAVPEAEGSACATGPPPKSDRAGSNAVTTM